MNEWPKKCVGSRCGGVDIYPVTWGLHHRNTYHSRMMCERCAAYAQRNGLLLDYPPIMKAAADTAQDFMELRRRGLTNQEIADRLNVNMKSALRSISRHNSRQGGYDRGNW